MAAMFYKSLFSNSKMAAMLSFSPIGAEMAEVHVYLSLFHSVCGGRGQRHGKSFCSGGAVSSGGSGGPPPENFAIFRCNFLHSNQF